MWATFHFMDLVTSMIMRSEECAETNVKLNSIHQFTSADG